MGSETTMIAEQCHLWELAVSFMEVNGKIVFLMKPKQFQWKNLMTTRTTPKVEKETEETGRKPFGAPSCYSEAFHG